MRVKQVIMMHEIPKQDNQMKKTINKPIFSWTDAWVFTALYISIKDENRIDLSGIISAGDALNHSILNDEEIKSAFIKLQKRGIIQITKEKVKYTSLGKLVIEKAENVREGMFSRVDVTLKKLNYNRLELPFIEEINKCDFVTKENVLKAYQDYRKTFGN